MDTIKSKLESVYNHGFRTTKREVPSSVKCVIDQFVENGWITNVQYYVSESWDQLIVFGETKLHHDVFYNNPLTKLLWKMRCFVAPNRHCANILGAEGVNRIIIDVKDFRRLLCIEKGGCRHAKSYKSVEALAAVVEELLFDAVRRH